jgi:NAD(P)H dehydrogenase (quinone)
MTGKLLVTGASGHLGAGVLRHLLDTFNVPASSIVAGSRDTPSWPTLAGRGVETRKVDFNDAGTLEALFPASTADDHLNRRA